MKELNRILIEPERISESKNSNRIIFLNSKELHYLVNVMRIKLNEKIIVVDGGGNLWEANFESNGKIRLLSDINKPKIYKNKTKPLLCLAIVMPKKGFEDIIRMSCELGIDKIQILNSHRSVAKTDNNKKLSRWETISKEAIEQSERLWKPEINASIDLNEWFNTIDKNYFYSYGATRRKDVIHIYDWMNSVNKETKQIWVTIGPEGGWSEQEEEMALGHGFTAIGLGETILRTSTASITATALMASWKRNIV